MEITFKDNILKYDVEYNGLKQQSVELQHDIIGFTFEQGHIHINCDGEDYILYDVETPEKTRLISKSDYEAIRKLGIAFDDYFEKQKPLLNNKEIK